MSHRASRPLLRLPLRRLPRRLLRTATGLVGAVSESRPGRLLVAVCALVVLGPAGYAAFGPVAVPRDTHRQAMIETIPRLTRDVEVAREGDRQAELPRDAVAPTAGPTPPSPGATDLTVPAPTATPTTAATTPTATPVLHTHPSRPTPRPTPKPSPTPSPKPSPKPRPTPKPDPTGTSAHRDTTTPNTTVVAQYTSRNAVTLLLASDEPASFVCSLDGAPYTACSSPASYLGLSPGWHSLAVRAIDAAGNVDPTPATAHWHARGGS